MGNYWRVKLHVIRAKPRVVAQWLPYQLLALASCRALVVGTVVAVLPALAAMVQSFVLLRVLGLLVLLLFRVSQAMPVIILDGVPLLVIFIATVMLSLCMETTALVVCLQSTMLQSLNIGDGSRTDENFRAVISVVAHSAFWELDRHGSEPSTVPAWSPAPNAMYNHGDTVTRAAGNGMSLVYHAVGACWPGLDPVGFYSRSLRVCRTT
jgi:hypothetical protein